MRQQRLKAIPQLAFTMGKAPCGPSSMELFGRLRNPLTLLALVLAQTLWLAVQVQRPVHSAASAASAASVPMLPAIPGATDNGKVTLLRFWSMAVFGPVERSLHATGSGVRSMWANYVDLRHTRERDKALRGEILRLREEQASFAEDAAEGRRLESLLAFKQQYIAKTVAAQVIGTSGSDQSHVLWINKGSADGLAAEQAVITPDGVVGKLRDVMPHTAQLLLLNDASSGAGVLLASTRMRGILRGTATGEVVIDNLTPDERIKPGEAVLTSGGDQVFPRGLPVGVITAVALDPRHPPYTLIHIRPAANLRRLEEVLVVTGTVPDLPLAAQTDAAQAQATAEANKRAADMIAERLPSLHGPEGQAGAVAGAAAAVAGIPGAGAAPAKSVDESAKESAKETGGVPGIPNSGMPKAQPALHPDRFSPGVAPPAADLTPGAPRPPP